MMPDSSEPLVDKVASLLKHDHRFIPVNHSSIGSEDHCGCGFRPRGWHEWSEHVAQAAIDALEEHIEAVRREAYLDGYNEGAYGD